MAAASKIFADKGADGSRIDEIAEAAGLNKRMIYHYFGSKEELYVEVLRVNYYNILSLGKQAFKLGGDPKENITRAVSAYFYFLAKNPAFVRLTSWDALSGGRLIGRVIPQFFDLVELEFADIIKDGIERKFIQSNIDFRQVVLSVHGLCLTYFNRREIVQPIWSEDMLSEEMLAKRLEHILDLLFNGILSKEKRCNG